jgi:hypothetical protein
LLKRLFDDKLKMKALRCRNVYIFKKAYLQYTLIENHFALPKVSERVGQKQPPNLILTGREVASTAIGKAVNINDQSGRAGDTVDTFTCE